MTSDPHEAEFVGQGRRGIVAGLLDAFDRARTDQRPVWVSLEAPTGWGKTRIAREFYSALAQTQTEPPYWPSTMAAARSKVSERRKIINPPDFEHLPMSRPDYLWWGIACGRRNGTATESLLQDVAVLRKHIDHLENAWWYRAGFVEKFAYPAFAALRAKVLEEGVAAVVDFGVTKAAEMVGGALPGFSAMSWLVRKGVSEGKAARARSKNLRSAEEIVYRPSEVDEVESFLAKIAPLIPVVLFVEDVHDADDLLLELLQRLIRRDAPVMILTTGWPGVIDANPGVARAMGRAGERLIRVDEEMTTLPSPFPPEASLQALDTDDLASIMGSHVAQVSPATRNALVSAYRNPFALELVLETYGDPDGDVLDIESADVERLSGKVEDVYKSAWERLDEADRERLTLATLAIPAIVSARASDSQSWDNVMFDAALSRLGQHGTDAQAERNAVERTWVRSVDEYLCQFHDAAQMNVAAAEFATATRRQRVREALIDEARHLIADHSTPADRSAQASRLLLAYGAEIDEHDFADATRALVGVLGELHQETDAIARLGDDTDLRLDLGDQRDRDLLWTFAQAQRELGNPKRAIELLEKLLEAERKVYGRDASELLGTRRAIASAVASDGRPQAAVEMLEDVLAQQLTTHVASDADVLDTRAELSLAFADADRPQDAIRLNEDLLVTQAKTFGDDSAELTETRRRLAAVMAETGRPEDALRIWEQIAADISARSGRDSPDALAARSRLAMATEDALGAEEAIGQYTALLADQRRVLGPDARDVLVTSANLARTSGVPAP
ncbi:tetratricopeptide repeat protein [Herbiconiux sp. UC225_62]|uniref:tetratricopeptide repeat protein n=1 Tax=Herbiconiux sp. UC225_62 TaxID=3350168 RepID=UPI0036D35C65